MNATDVVLLFQSMSSSAAQTEYGWKDFVRRQQQTCQILLHEHVLKIFFSGNIFPGKLLPGKCLIREITNKSWHANIRETSFRENAYPENVSKPTITL